MKTQKLMIGMTLVAIFAFAACESDENAVVNDDLNPGETTENVMKPVDYAVYLNLLNLTDVEEATDGEELKSGTVENNPCMNVTVHENEDGAFWPRKWTVDFGDENCEGFDGNLRRGQIETQLSDRWRNLNATRTIAYNNFFLNDEQFAGTKTITNVGFNESSNLFFEKTYRDGLIVNVNGDSLSFEFDQTSEMIAGYDSHMFADDEYLVRGTSAGTDFDGNAFVSEITVPLHYRNRCFYPVSGEVTFTVADTINIVVDYGAGDCDNIISITTPDGTEEIEL